ncbi:MAG TPA: SDR family oxidoreductase [Chitinophagaceae bacterium]|nr:SDR family oxidoreductase [Chitinophagaceae bacterium]
MEKLNNKNVLVAGATGGIGEATAKLLAQSGANLFIAGRKKAKLDVMAADLNIPANRIFELDLTSPETVEAMSNRIHTMVPQIDILINATGIGIIKPLEQLSVEEFRLSLQVNLEGSFLLVKSFLPAMKATGKGLIINIPGVLGKVPMAGAAAYSASKYGLVGMMQSIREELKRTEIRITNIFMGGVDSAFWDNINMRVQREKMVRADEAARAIWFLCQQPSSGVVSEMVLQPFNHQAI